MRVPRKEQTGFDPGILEDLERGVIPKGWELARKGPRRYYGFNALNQCCRRWMLLGWPEVDGKPAKHDEGILSLECPKCGGMQHYDLNGPAGVVMKDTHQPPAIVAGMMHGLSDD